MKICKENLCTGCMACVKSCPKQCIILEKNNRGEEHPHIDTTKCVSCGACRKACLNEANIEFSSPLRTFAAWSFHEDDCKYSSSGGVASVFSRKMIKSGGVVFGAASQNKTVEHILVETEDDIEYLRGSKYVQSNVVNVYSVAKNLLEQGKKVLFTGTPCQVAGLKLYLKKEYQNILTVDLICHGTPPIAYLQEHLSRIDWTDVSFRGYYNWKLTATNKEKVVYQKDRYDDEYFTAFLEGLIFRESCYSCKFARQERISDITIGDFWGLNRTTIKVPYDGRVSLVLANSEKGLEFIKQCNSEMYFEEREFSEALNPSQTNLQQPSMRPTERDRLLSDMTEVGFDKAVQATDVWKKTRKAQHKKKFLMPFIKIDRKLKKIFIK